MVMDNTKKYIAEAYGTAVLVVLGCGTAMVWGKFFGNLGIALSFGMTLTAMTYSLGHISGAHFNPAVTIWSVSSGHMKWTEGVKYMVAQFLGATLWSVVLYAIAVWAVGPTNINFLWQNEIAKGFDIKTAFIVEAITTYIFVKIYLGTASVRTNASMFWIVVGLSYTLMHFMTMPITGTSLNPARSFWPALWLEISQVGNISSNVWLAAPALQQLWIFTLAPLLWGLLAWMCHHWMEKKK